MSLVIHPISIAVSRVVAVASSFDSTSAAADMFPILWDTSIYNFITYEICYMIIPTYLCGDSVGQCGAMRRQCGAMRGQCGSMWRQCGAMRRQCGAVWRVSVTVLRVSC